MAVFCTCGTELPENARFCFNCGKPQREQDQQLPDPEGGPDAAQSPQFIPPRPATPPVNFGNPIAVRVALMCASLSALFSVIPIVSFGCCLWIIGAGFLSTIFYTRRTGLIVSVGDGMRLGWITGLLTFVIGLVLTALGFLAARSAGGFREIIQQSLARIPAQDAVTQQVRDFLSSPAGLVMFVMTYAIFFFIVIVSLAIAGGALGAKVMEKE
jgi:hypothetical protein